MTVSARHLGGFALALLFIAGALNLVHGFRNERAEEADRQREARARDAEAEQAARLGQTFGEVLQAHPYPHRVRAKKEGPDWAGRMLVVDTSRKRTAVSPWHSRLPAARRATAPHDLESIAYVDCKPHTVGRYGMGAEARVQYCNVTVVDRKRWTVTAETVLGGPQPPPMLPEGQGYDGPPPVDAVVAYLAGLPPAATMPSTRADAR